MAKQELSQAQVIQAVYAYAAHLIKVGHSRMQVEDRLVERGLDREAAPFEIPVREVDDLLLFARGTVDVDHTG